MPHPANTIVITPSSTSRATLLSDAMDEIHESPAEKFQRYAKMILPHIGLVILLGVYTVVGAGVFHLLEAPHERFLRNQSMQHLTNARLNFLETLWNLTLGNESESDPDKMTFQVWSRQGVDQLQEMELWIVKSFDQRRLYIQDLQNDTSEIWTFQAAIFFASTVITTIGYGNLTPMTLSGRIFCIGFGLFGIPLLLITIADIGKFLSDLITFIYKSYRRFKLQVRRSSRKISVRGGIGPYFRRESTATTLSSVDDEEEIRIPVWMVLLFLASYTAVGGILFRFWEGWDYFEAFYFCFITMATIGFGDLVPSEQMYMFFTMIYIVIGLAVTTMCIDLAGTEYIRKIHYFGTKIETAKDLFETGVNVGGDLLKQMQGIALLRKKGLLPQDFEFDPESLMEDAMLSDFYGKLRNNILYEPVSPQVKKYLKPGMNITPDEIDDADAWVLENKMFGKQTFRRQKVAPTFRRYSGISSRINSTSPRPATPLPVFVAPFIMKESQV